MRISDWSSDVCSSDLALPHDIQCLAPALGIARPLGQGICNRTTGRLGHADEQIDVAIIILRIKFRDHLQDTPACFPHGGRDTDQFLGVRIETRDRSEEHTSELQSLLSISYAVFCLKKK